MDISWSIWHFKSRLTHYQEKVLLNNLMIDPSVFFRRFDLYQICIYWFTVVLKTDICISNFNAMCFYIIFAQIYLINNQLNSSLPLHSPNSSFLWISDRYDFRSEPNLTNENYIWFQYITWLRSICLHQWNVKVRWK